MRAPPRLQPDARSERALADHVLEYPNEVLLYSATELADRAGASKAAVSRFVKRIGYGDFREMQREIHFSAATLTPWYDKCYDLSPGCALPPPHAARLTPRRAARRADISELSLESTMKLDFFNGKEDLMNFRVSFKIIEGIYKGGSFVFKIEVPKSYPHDAPKVAATAAVTL